MNDDQKATHTIPEASRILGIGRNSAYEAARRGVLPTISFGRRLVVPDIALRHLLASKIPEPEGGHRCDCCFCRRG